MQFKVSFLQEARLKQTNKQQKHTPMALKLQDDINEDRNLAILNPLCFLLEVDGIKDKESEKSQKVHISLVDKSKKKINE